MYTVRMLREDLEDMDPNLPVVIATFFSKDFDEDKYVEFKTTHSLMAVYNDTFNDRVQLEN